MFNFVSDLLYLFFKVFPLAGRTRLLLLYLEAFGQTCNKVSQVLITCFDGIHYLDSAEQQIPPLAFRWRTPIFTNQILFQFFNQCLDGSLLITDDQYPLLTVDAVQQQVHDGESLAGAGRSLEQHDIVLIEPVH